MLVEGLMNFDAKDATIKTVEWIRNWFDKNGKGCNAIVGISGGKDSSIAAAICAHALGKERVIGVMMPNGEQSDIDMARLLINHLGIKSYTVNIGKTFDALVKEIEAYASPDAIIASSTSGLLVTEIAKYAQHPERFIGGHPYNPPHLIPLVEITKGEKTADEAV